MRRGLQLLLLFCVSVYADVRIHRALSKCEDVDNNKIKISVSTGRYSTTTSWWFEPICPSGYKVKDATYSRSHFTYVKGVTPYLQQGSGSGRRQTCAWILQMCCSAMHHTHTHTHTQPVYNPYLATTPLPPPVYRSKCQIVWQHGGRCIHCHQ